MEMEIHTHVVLIEFDTITDNFYKKGLFLQNINNCKGSNLHL